MVCQKAKYYIISAKNVQYYSILGTPFYELDAVSLNPLPDIYAFIRLFQPPPPYAFSNGEKLPYLGSQTLVFV
jgi:hypothetical protein